MTNVPVPAPQVPRKEPAQAAPTHTKEELDAALDEALDESFPASDPVSISLHPDAVE